jgi:hypothetical protein
VVLHFLRSVFLERPEFKCVPGLDYKMWFESSFDAKFTILQRFFCADGRNFPDSVSAKPLDNFTILWYI